MIRYEFRNLYTGAAAYVALPMDQDEEAAWEALEKDGLKRGEYWLAKKHVPFFN